MQKKNNGVRQKQFLFSKTIGALSFLSTLSFSLLFYGCINEGKTHPPSQKSVSQKIVSDSFPFSWVVNGIHYSVFYSGENHFAIRSKRPSADSGNISMCIAGAFTLLDDNTIDGLYIENGAIVKTKANHHLGGGLLINGNSLSIIKTFDGKLLTSSWRDSIAALHCSFFQQIQLVRSDSALRFGKDQKYFQRRAIVIFKNGKTAIVESKEPVLLQTFADALVAMDAKDALYTDMGGWDEGWYRTANGKIKAIGAMRSDTPRQSNWVILEK